MNIKNLRSYILCVCTIVICIVLDQITKSSVLSYLKEQPGMVHDLLSWLKLVHHWNYGISYSLFSNFMHNSNRIFAILNSIIVVILLYITYKESDISKKIVLSLIIGGAIGNIYDRIVRGAVFDFIYLHYGEYDFAVFNIADMCISVGAVALILLHQLDAYYIRKEASNRGANDVRKAV